ncbi:MAG: hypothetical protein Q8R44_04490 [Novosphingobium sp.]|nr:hypothetical protein [Novosphingobium sp.]
MIDWTTFNTAPGGGPIIFQPSGTTATFTSASDFSVLNRIIPTDQSRAIQFNGTVIAQIQGASNVPGGSVYFYSPGGVIVGSSAVFNVGNLGLTSIAPAVVGGVFEQTGTTGEFVQFNGEVRPGSAVTIQPGARITGTAPSVGSYLAIVAPQINQGGTIDGKRVSALVSADAATITLNESGLFDIQITAGTSATGTTLSNFGSITGPAATVAGQASRIYLVAVPKNDAITMAVSSGSTLGFDIADAANVVGNAVVLSGGFDIVGGQVAATPSSGGGTGQVNTFADPNTVTSAISIASTGRALLFANGGRTSNYASDVSISGATPGATPTDIAAQVGSFEAGSQLNIAGNLSVTALDPTIVAPSSGLQVSNEAVVDATGGGNMMIGGNVTITNNKSGALNTNVVAGSGRLAANGGSRLTIGGNAFVITRAQGGNATGGNASVSADTGGTVDVAGVLRLRAEGIGGVGGSGMGGTAAVSARTGGDILAGQLNVSADGLGGADSAGSGAGAGRGGNAAITASGAGSTITIANGNTSGIQANGELDFLSAEGFGGATSGGGSATGGAGTGGSATISVNTGATFTGPANVGSTGFVRIIARGTGGNGLVDGTTGGQATGGNINITVDNATMTSAEMLPSAFAQGGGIPFISEGPGGIVNGGNAVGGNRHITVRNGGTLTTSLGGGSAGAVGGNATQSGRGGDASGGNASLTVDNATFNVTDRALFFTQNTGGDGGTGGNATGGSVTADIRNGGVVNVSTTGLNQQFLVSGDNRGGNSFTAAGTIGGNATGGLGQILLNGGTLNAADVRISAIGVGGSGLLNQGGNGAGGTARLQLNGGTLTGTQLTVDATGAGGAIDPSVSGNGGNGAGGLATIDSNTNATTLNFTRIEVQSQGFGRVSGGLGGNGGAGSGGTGQIIVTGGSNLTVNAPDTFVEADGEGGDALGSSGNGGAGNAGRSVVSIDGASATFNGNLSLSGDSDGGDGITGGNAFGDPENNMSRALVFARNGSLAVTGLMSLHAVASGGQGRLTGNGGNASGGFANVVAANGINTTGLGIITLGDLDIDSGAQGGFATGTGNGGNAGAGRAHLFVNGGTITVGGNASLFGDAIGGDGVNGGNAISARPNRQPRALIGSFNGTISVRGTTLLEATAAGGNGTAGGTGGIAFAGQAAIDAQSNNGPSTINLASVLIDASATGGFGGDGVGSQAGGSGGEAYGGVVGAFGNAGQGVLSISGDTILSAAAFGGEGGQGGSGGTTAPGAAGGAGGRAIAGGVTVGTISGIDTPSNTGSATFRTVLGDASAFGGTGGAGGTGTTTGAGGAGGTGFGGTTGILVRGSPATFADVTLSAVGHGGAGGTGSVQGDGGDGYAGDGFVIVTQRFNRTERGSLTAGNVTIATAGIGGAGATAGDTFFSAAQGAEGELFVRQSDVNLGSLSLTTSGALAPNLTTTILSVIDPATGQAFPSGIPAPRSVTVATEPFDLNLADSTVNIAGDLTLATAGDMRISLGSSTLNTASLTLAANNFVLPATRPATLGTISVSGALNISSGLDFLAFANFNVGQSGFFDADGSVLTGDLTFGGDLGLFAAGSITTGVVSAASVDFIAGTSINTLAVNADGSIDLVATGPVSTGALTAGDSVFVNAGGAVSVGAVSAGIVNPVATSADGYTIGLRSLTSVAAGNLAARGSIGLSSPGALGVGDLSAGNLVLALPGTSFTSGAITTTAASGGRVYIANHSMEALGGEIGGTFDPGLILAAPQVATGGPIAINGAVATDFIQANTTQTLTITGATTARSTAVLVGGQALSAGNVTVGDQAILASGGALTVGNVDAGITIAGPGPRKIAIGSTAGPVTTGSLSAAGDLGVQTGGAISTGNLRGRDVLLLAGGSVAAASVTAGGGTQPLGRVYVGNFSQATSAANVFQPFSQAGVATLFNTDPLRTGGSLAFSGAVDARSLVAAAQQDISLQAVTAGTATLPGFVGLDSGGLVSINGRVAAGEIDIVSRDIDITAIGSLDALSLTGEIQLASTNPNGMFIGDNTGATSGSYQLSNAEFGRLKAGEIALIGDDLSGTVDMVVGDLTVTAAQLYTDGQALFATGNRATETPSGILRVNGNVAASGFGLDSPGGLTFLSGTFELNAATGSLNVTSSGNAIAGTIEIDASRIHVASDEILLRLRADPLYAGHVEQLNAPAAVQRPDGVLRAGALALFPSETLYIQNTGSTIVPAGFLTRLDFTEIEIGGGESGSSTAKAELVFNGQFQTSTGVVTGKAAFDLALAQARADAMVDGEMFGTNITDASTFNSCGILSGTCALGGTTPLAPPASEITVIVTTPLATSPPPPAVDDAGPGDSSGSGSDSEAAEESDEGESQEEDESEDGDEAASPIAPPTPLISTRALDRDANVVEPVSGAGNPALFGSAVNETTVQGEKP